MSHGTMPKYFNIRAHIKDGQDINGYGWSYKKEVTPSYCQISKEDVLGCKALGISQWLTNWGPEAWRQRIRDHSQLTVLEAGRGGSPALYHAREGKVMTPRPLTFTATHGHMGPHTSKSKPSPTEVRSKSQQLIIRYCVPRLKYYIVRGRESSLG